MVLISRTQSKLDTAAGEIEAKYKVKTKTLAVDFGKADSATWSMLKAELAPLAVGVLVNNVGVSYPHAEFYEAIDDQLIDDLININIQATNKVGLTYFPTQYFAVDFKARTYIGDMLLHKISPR